MKRQMTKFKAAAAGVSFAVSASACTGQIPNSFRLAQQEQDFSSQQEINTKIDLLWVIDNSASMDVSQQKLRQGFAGFARKYMKPTWDIRVGVITTDTYMAHPSFSGYLGRTIPQTAGWQSPYISGRLATWVNPSWNPSLVNMGTGKFEGGVKFGDLVPVWGPNYSRLLPGLHDGPITALCSELMPYFYTGVTLCTIRDNQNAYNGPSKCLNPGSGESSVSQCVNTIQNDSIHSGKAIISTMPPAGVAGDDAWTNQLIQDFMINVTTGSAGQGSERGLGSLQQLLADNESTNTSFFRAGSLRGIIFVSDEEDQTIEIPSSVDANFKPQTFYKCDQTSLIALNGATPVTGTNGYCCSDPSKNCSYGSEGTSCDSKTIDGYTYTISVCPKPEKLVPVQTVKDQLDSFFSALDQNSAGSGTYFITSIVALNAQAIQTLQAERNTNDTAVGAIKTHAVDRGDRYLELGNLVGNGSLAMNIADDDYSPILDAIGRAIISKKSTFTLARAPTGTEDMVVQVKHADGTTTVVGPEKFVIEGKSLIFIDQDFILSLSATDKMSINYQPKTLF